MTQKTICDRCGADQNVGRFTIDFARSDPHTSDSLPVNRDSDLCEENIRLAEQIRGFNDLPLSTNAKTVAKLNARIAELETQSSAQFVAGMRRAAEIAKYACLVPPDGGEPTEDERRMCDAASDAILAEAALSRRGN